MCLWPIVACGGFTIAIKSQLKSIELAFIRYREILGLGLDNWLTMTEVESIE